MILEPEAPAARDKQNSIFLKKVEKFLSNFNGSSYGENCDCTTAFIEMKQHGITLTMTHNFELEYRRLQPDYMKWTFSTEPFVATLAEISTYCDLISRFITTCSNGQWVIFLASMMQRYRHTRVEFHHHRVGLSVIHFITNEASIRLFIDEQHGYHILLSEIHGIYPKFTIDKQKASGVCNIAMVLLENQVNALRLIQDNIRAACP